MKRIGGPLLIALGMMHTVVGMIVFAFPTRQIAAAGFVNGVILHPLARIASNGFYRVVEEASPRMAAFWFYWSGFSWMLLGALCYWLEKRLRQPVPGFLGWGLLAYASIGALLLPLSGFWALIGISIYMIRAAGTRSLYETAPASISPGPTPGA